MYDTWLIAPRGPREASGTENNDNNQQLHAYKKLSISAYTILNYILESIYEIYESILLLICI